MEFVNVVAYCAVLISLTMAPGPMMAVLVARTFGRDVTGAVAFSVGIALGDALVVGLICAGLGLWLQSMPEIFDIGKFGALAYLGWIAYGMWNASQTQQAQPAARNSGFISSAIAGMLTCMISPQTILLYLLILPRLVDVSTIDLPAFGMVLMITFAALAITLALVIFLADRFRNLLGSQKDSTLMNRVFASVIMLSGVWMIAG